MINKIAYLLVIISLFMSAANVNAAEDNTDMQILIANQKKGIVCALCCNVTGNNHISYSSSGAGIR